MIEFTPTRTSTASIETLFDVMTDHRGLVDTTWMFRRTTLEREGTAAQNGVGAIRRLVAIGPPFIEEIVEYERPTRWAYTLLSGAPIRDHLGTIELREAGTGTQVSCHHRRAPCRRCMSVQIRQPELFWGAAPIGLDTSASVGCGTHAVGLHAVRDLIGVATQLHRCSPKRRGLRGHRAR